MPVVTFSSKTMPESSEALRSILQNALDKASPIEDFIQVVRDLTRFELQHQLGSQEFFERFQQGEMGDRIEYMRWANKYEIYQEMKGSMNISLSCSHNTHCLHLRYDPTTSLSGWIIR